VWLNGLVEARALERRFHIVLPDPPCVVEHAVDTGGTCATTLALSIMKVSRR
jgi:hypothetical protein